MVFSKMEDIVEKIPNKKVSISINLIGLVRKIIKKIKDKRGCK